MNLKKKYATETQRHRDRTRRQGDKETRGQGEKRLVSLSPLLLVSPSFLTSVSPWLCGKFIGLAATVVMALSFGNACAEAPGKSSDIYTGSRPATLAADEPEPPRVYLDTTYTTPKGRSIEVKAGGDLQAALNQAKPDDAITLEA